MFNNFFEQIAQGDMDCILILVWCIFRFALGIIEIIAAKKGFEIKKGVANVEKDLQKESLNSVKKTRKYQKVFTPYVRQYAYDEETGSLVEDGFVDVDELIKSHIDTSFEKILEKFLPTDELEKFMPGIGYRDEQAGVQSYSDEIDDLTDVVDFVNDMKAKYGLNPDMDVNEVLEAVKDLKKDVDLKVEKLKTKQTQAPTPQDEQIDVEEAIAFYKANHGVEVQK